MAKKKPQWPRVRQRKNKGGTASWLVDLTRKGMPRQRKFFKTREAAEIFAEQKRIEDENFGNSALSLSETVKAEAARLLPELSKAGATLTEAVEYFLRHRRPGQQEKTVQAVVDELIEKREKMGRSKGYLQVQRSVLTTFAKLFGPKKIHEVVAGDIESWLEGNTGWSARTRLNYHRDISTLWNYAVKRHYAPTNPLAAILRPTISGNGKVGKVTVEDAAKLLKAARKHDRDGTLAYVAIGLFAGLRPAEIERLEWAEVDLRSRLIEVTGEKSKTRQRRHVVISENLFAWLGLCMDRAGKVCRRAAMYKKVAELAKSARIVLPRNGLRHSFASYHLTKHKDAAKTALELGHNSQDLLFRNYREIVTPAAADAYWALLPKQKTTKRQKK